MNPVQWVESPPLSFLGGGDFKNAPDWLKTWESMASQGSAIFLESAGPIDECARWSILAGCPQSEIWGRGRKIEHSIPAISSPEFPDVLNFLDSIAQTKLSFEPFPSCLSNSWFGAFSYEFGKERNICKDRPDFYFFKPGQLWVVDRLKREWFQWGRSEWAAKGGGEKKSEPFRVDRIQANMTLNQYVDLAKKAKKYIAQGDIYQANLAQKFECHWSGNPSNLYRLLREMNPGPFMGLFKGPHFTIISSSPERLISGRGKILETRPIAGTRPRVQHPEDDLRLKSELQTNPKEQAEHLMLVDLMRNDLGRVARYGTVRVRDYARIESYAKVHHLVSTVQAEVQEGMVFSDIFQSVFPGGTITGCPKIRCMQIIEELENQPRNFYTGSMGYLTRGPVFDFNILIRSFTLWPEGKLEFFAGAGIVADSDPEREYLETLHKVEALAQALGTSFLTP
jgi:anthranilate/para-aminobenzoate synthase component I